MSGKDRVKSERRGSGPFSRTRSSLRNSESAERGKGGEKRRRSGVRGRKRSTAGELEGSAHSVRPVLTPKRKKGQVTVKKEGEGNREKVKPSRQRRKSVKRGVKRESVDEPDSGTRPVKKGMKKLKSEGIKKEEEEPLPVQPGSSAERETEKGSVKMEGIRRKLIGAHMSIAGGLWNAVQGSVTIGGCVFGMFLGSQRSWKSQPLDEKAVARFRQACSQHGFTPDRILPHGSYLLNCGSPKPDVYEKSRAMLIDELKRCEQLGLTMFNFHPGSTLHDITVEECLDRIADSINHAHQHTTGVTTVIENMSCQGNTVGGKFSELRGIIDRVKDKSRIGVCLDTCHAFAAGHDLSAVGGVKKMLDEFDWTVGLQYLKAVHLNDSKGKLGCHLDRHENIGEGEIGLEGFRQIVNEPRLDNMPMILETPVRPDMDGSQEIQLLYSLCQ
ncbi:probable endonuclease 4 isoform X1 [Acipenser ruthenus]|uniref:probable endonuclease 4 isoform X1 n=1 Tax=Acipenser ruthenus TaxID=7906 RepID=UPI002740C925|nr:probable endonuclease 4 isoform X1 [Acipenser ruthenus]